MQPRRPRPWNGETKRSSFLPDGPLSRAVLTNGFTMRLVRYVSLALVSLALAVLVIFGLLCFYIDYYGKDQKRIQKLVKSAISWEDALLALQNAIKEEFLQGDFYNYTDLMKEFEDK